MVGAGSAIFWILGKENLSCTSPRINPSVLAISGASVFVIFLHALLHQTPNQEAFGVQMEEA